MVGGGGTAGSRGRRFVFSQLLQFPHLPEVIQDPVRLFLVDSSNREADMNEHVFSNRGVGDVRQTDFSFDPLEAHGTASQEGVLAWISMIFPGTARHMVQNLGRNQAPCSTLLEPLRLLASRCSRNCVQSCSPSPVRAEQVRTRPEELRVEIR